MYSVEMEIQAKRKVLAVLHDDINKIINDIAGYISGIAFRLSNTNISVLKKSNFDKDIKTLIDKVVESIFKLNEMARALSINLVNTIELAQEVQKLEREV